MAKIQSAWILIAFLTFALSCGVAVAQEKRVALLIGNSGYKYAPNLPNPANDASDLANSLERIGFDVNVVLDADFKQMRVALRDFADVATNSDIALVYFAGHGIEIDNTNYLIPVNAELKTDLEIEFESLRLDALMRSLAGSRGLKLVLVDACRNNPFISDMQRTSATRSIGRGLRRLDPDGGVLVGYAARAGTLALDGDGRNSPYASALLRHIEEPGLELGKMFRKVRDTVQDLTDGYQEPFTYGSLPGRDIYLVPAVASATDVLADFAGAEIKNTKENWKSFLERYGTSDVDREVLAKARQKLAMLSNSGSDSGGYFQAGVENSAIIRACDRLAADPNDELIPKELIAIPDEEFKAEAAKSACSVAASGHPGHARSSYQLARALIALGEKEAGMSLMEEVALSGYLAAEVVAGAEILKRASKGGSNVTLGTTLLKNAIDGGSALGAYELSRFYRTSKGFDRELSKKYLELAAKRGEPNAKFEIGKSLLHFRETDPARYSLGLGYVRDAADAGVVRAQVRIANLYFDQEIDTELAVSYLVRAAHSGSIPAQKSLVAMYSFGRGAVLLDVSRAVPWMEALAANGEDIRWLHLGYIHEAGRGAEANPRKAAQYYLKALAAGLPYLLSRAVNDWDKATAMALQRLLGSSSKAAYKGIIDGVVGAGTRAAMQRLCDCRPKTLALRFTDVFRQVPSFEMDLNARINVGNPYSLPKSEKRTWNYKRAYLEAGVYEITPKAGRYSAWRFNRSAITCNANGRNCGDDGWNWDFRVIDGNDNPILSHGGRSEFRTPDLAFQAASLSTPLLRLNRAGIVGFGIGDHYYSGGDNSGGVSFLIERVSDQR